jgi:hypothetical protein
MMCSLITTKSVRAVTFATAGLFAISTAAFAADVAKEVSIAEQHANYAATATVITTTDSHLHHVINCLVGPKGKGFDAKQLDPCKGMGNGAIADTADAAKRKTLQAALAKAEAGLRTKDLAKAKADAAAAETLLKKEMM